jgi:hypothetical protein
MYPKNRYIPWGKDRSKSYIPLYTTAFLLYIPWYIPKPGIYHGIFHGATTGPGSQQVVYTMVYTMVYTIVKWYIPWYIVYTHFFNVYHGIYNNQCLFFGCCILSCYHFQVVMPHRLANSCFPPSLTVVGHKMSWRWYVRLESLRLGRLKLCTACSWCRQRTECRLEGSSCLPVWQLAWTQSWRYQCIAARSSIDFQYQ